MRMVYQFHDGYLSLHLILIKTRMAMILNVKNAWHTYQPSSSPARSPAITQLTFNKTDLLNFSLLIILTATVFLVTQ